MSNPENIMNLLPDNYRRLEAPLSAANARFLVGLKSAHDAVFDFFERLTHDHRRVDESDTFRAEIENAQQIIRPHLDLLNAPDTLVNFFFMCCLRAIRQGEADAGRYFPLKIEDLETEVIRTQEVADAMAMLDDRHVALYSGIFIGEGDEIDPLLKATLETARLGTPVSADDAFIFVDSFEVLSSLLPHGEFEGYTERQRGDFLLEKIKQAYDFTELEGLIEEEKAAG